MAKENTQILSLYCNPMAKETCLYGKRDLLVWQKRPTYIGTVCAVPCLRCTKETYLYCKRDLLVLPKRDLLVWQKRPAYIGIVCIVPCLRCTKETCVYGKRDLCTRRERPAYMCSHVLICANMAEAGARQQQTLD